MLYKGKIIWSGTVKEMDKTDNPYVKQFINGATLDEATVGISWDIHNKCLYFDSIK